MVVLIFKFKKYLKSLFKKDKQVKTTVSSDTKNNKHSVNQENIFSFAFDGDLIYASMPNVEEIRDKLKKSHQQSPYYVSIIIEKEQYYLNKANTIRLKNCHIIK